jgi:hypothetical protein
MKFRNNLFEGVKKFVVLITLHSHIRVVNLSLSLYECKTGSLTVMEESTTENPRT